MIHRGQSLHISPSSTSQTCSNEKENEAYKNASWGVWTDEKVDELKRLFDGGKHNAREMAAELGVTRSTILGKLFRLGLKRVGHVRGANFPRAEHRPRKAAPPRPRKPPKVYDDKPKLRIVSSGPGGFRTQMSVTRMVVFAPDEVASLSVDLLDLKAGQCRAPYGDNPFSFCGHPVLEGQSYCAPHCARFYLPRARS